MPSTSATKAELELIAKKKKYIGEILKRAREERGISPESVGRVLYPTCYHTTAVKRVESFESGQMMVSFKSLGVLLAYFNLSEEQRKDLIRVYREIWHLIGKYARRTPAKIHGYKPELENIGMQILNKRARKHPDLTAYQFAQKYGISTRTIYLIENGKKYVSPPTFTKLATILFEPADAQILIDQYTKLYIDYKISTRLQAKRKRKEKSLQRQGKMDSKKDINSNNEAIYQATALVMPIEAQKVPFLLAIGRMLTIEELEYFKNFIEGATSKQLNEQRRLNDE